MKIAIDISQVVYGTGVSVYTKNLVENLIRIDKKNEYILFGGTLRRRQELSNFLAKFTDNKNVKTRIFSIPPTGFEFLFNRFRFLPIEALIGQIDLFHSSDWTQPKSKAVKVTTVHDLVPLKYPSYSHPKLVQAHRRRIEIIKKEIDAVIVPSKTTKHDLMQLGIVQDKIKVIPEAVSPNVKRQSKKIVEQIKSKYEIDRDYFLSVGITPRKNTQAIIDAYKILKQKKKFKKYSLVLIGHPYNGFNTIDGVVITGHIPFTDLLALYSGSKVFVYPSLYEGFGLPILEAMKCQTPVVTSNLGSMKEIARDSAVLVDPHQVEDIAKGVEKAFRLRKSLVKKGTKRVGDFSWKKTARKTLTVYNDYTSGVIL